MPLKKKYGQWKAFYRCNFCRLPLSIEQVFYGDAVCPLCGDEGEWAETIVAHRYYERRRVYVPCSGWWETLKSAFNGDGAPFGYKFNGWEFKDE